MDMYSCRGAIPAPKPVLLPQKRRLETFTHEDDQHKAQIAQERESWNNGLNSQLAEVRPQSFDSENHALSIV